MWLLACHGEYPNFRISLEVCGEARCHVLRDHFVGEYANMLNISSRTLTKYVAESRWRTPLQIINDRIALEAKRLIQSTSLRIKEVAGHLGFDDPSYFVKFLKRLTGKMPTELRSRLPRSE